MFCPKCGKMNNDELEICSGCGAKLHEESENKVEKKKSGAAIKGVIAAVVVVAAAAVVAFVSCDASAAQIVFIGI